MWLSDIVKGKNERYQRTKYRFIEIKFISDFIMDTVFHAHRTKAGYFNISIQT